MVLVNYIASFKTVKKLIFAVKEEAMSLLF